MLLEVVVNDHIGDNGHVSVISSYGYNGVSGNGFNDLRTDLKMA